MEIILVIVGFLALVIGLLGSVVPALPGPPVSFIGLLLIHFAGKGDFNILFLVIMGVITIAIMIADNFLPAWMTKRFGGSKKAVVGSIIGLIVGMIFFAPIGILAGPFLGALAGELINRAFEPKQAANNTKTSNETSAPISEQESADIKTENITADKSNIINDKKPSPVKVAWGAFLAFIVGTGAKLILCGFLIYFSFNAVFG
ncbi:MAG: DUF456 domain-containing protein [Treponema sp.]|nr:DUF456 domain-containing protein [Treponema sp.]